MKIIVLMLTLIILFLNLNGYKSFFKSSKLRTQEFKARLDKEEDKEKAKAILLFAVFIIASLYFTFYLTTGVIFGHGLLLLYGVFMGLSTIYNFFRAVNMLAKEEIKSGFLGRIWLPINTCYTIYFLYYYMN